MSIDRASERFLQSHQKEREKLALQEAKLEAARKALARAMAASEEKQEKWHRFKLAYADRKAGFEGRHADARDELRRMPASKYCEAVLANVTHPSQVSLVEAELATIERHFEKLTAAANARYLARDTAAYEAALNQWLEHDRKNPNSGGWRLNAATREQWILIDRIMAAAGLDDRPGKMTRGEAHDWIQAHGGNPRYGPAGAPVRDLRAPARRPLLRFRIAAEMRREWGAAAATDPRRAQRRGFPFRWRRRPPRLRPATEDDCPRGMGKSCHYGHR